MKKIYLVTLIGALFIGNAVASDPVVYQTCPDGTVSCQQQHMGDVDNSSSAEGTQSESSNSGTSSVSNDSGMNNSGAYDNSSQNSSTTTGAISGSNTGGADYASSSSSGNKTDANSNASTGASTATVGQANTGNSSVGNVDGSSQIGNVGSTSGIGEGAGSSSNSLSNGSNSSSEIGAGAGSSSNTVSSGSIAGAGVGDTSSNSGSNSLSNGSKSTSSNTNLTGSSADNSGGNSSNNVSQGQKNRVSSENNTRSGSSSDNQTQIDSSNRSSYYSKTVIHPAITPPSPPSVLAVGNMIKETLACGPLVTVIKEPIYGTIVGAFGGQRQVSQGYTYDLVPVLYPNGTQRMYQEIPLANGDIRIFGAQAVITYGIVGTASARGFAVGGFGNEGAGGQIGANGSASIQRIATNIQILPCDLGTITKEVIYVEVPRKKGAG